MTAPPTITSYIQQYAADWKTNGLPYAPFRLKVATDASVIWEGSGSDGYVRFWWVNARSDGFRPLGGLCTRDYDGADVHGVVVVRPEPGQESAVADPVEWVRAFTDSGSGNPRDLSAWYPVPPGGYVSLGLLFTNGDPPPPGSVWCVRRDLVKQLPYQGYWNDSGMHFKGDGHLSRGGFTVTSDGKVAESVPGKILIVPNTVVYGRIFTFFPLGIYDNPPYGLLLSEITAPASVVAEPPYPELRDGNVRDTGTETAHGVKQVTVVPYLGIRDDGYASRALKAPFYFVACERFWTITLMHRAASPAHDEERFTTGVTKERTEGFEKTTSVTVSATAGVEIGPGSASVSYEMTNSLTISQSETTSYMQQAELTIGVDVPANTAMERWRKAFGFRIYRPDGSMVPSTLNAISHYDVYDVAFPPAKVTETSRNVSFAGRTPTKEAAA